jgi:hypothetical protein
MGILRKGKPARLLAVWAAHVANQAATAPPPASPLPAVLEDGAVAEAARTIATLEAERDAAVIEAERLRVALAEAQAQAAQQRGRAEAAKLRRPLQRSIPY